jgi:hypothetical protein
LVPEESIEPVIETVSEESKNRLVETKTMRMIPVPRRLCGKEKEMDMTTMKTWRRFDSR